MVNWKFTTVDTLPELITKVQKENNPLYKGVYYYVKAERSDNRIFDLIFDFDCKKDVDKARIDCIKAIERLNSRFGIDSNSLEFGFSGNKGYYIRVPFQYFMMDVIPAPQKALQRFTNWFKQFTPTLDNKFYNNGRLFREPNTVHEGTGLYRINLTLKELKTLTTEEIKALSTKPRITIQTPPDKPYTRLYEFFKRIKIFSEIRKPKNLFGKPIKLESKTSVNIDHLPARYSYLSSGIPEGQRNDAVCKLIGVFKKCGLSKSEAMDEILEFNRRCNPPEKEKLVRYKVERLFR